VSAVRAGDVIAGKFQIERILGEGGMGYVVAARHLQLGQMVALKFMRDDVLTAEYKSRFLREARNTVRLKSKHVSRVLDVGALDEGAPYMVMEYLEGTDLSDLLQKRGPFPVAEACDYVIQACEAIAEAHGHGIVHRDLKPANLFLTRGTGGEPVVKVLDFGVSKVVDLDFDDTSAGGRPRMGQSHDPNTAVTRATDLLGSPSYMSPEQIESARNADARSDIWSLGVILFRLISGKAPFTGQTLGDLIQKVVKEPIPNLRDVMPDIPAGLEDVVARCLERSRDKRIQDAVELARSLAPYAGPNAAPSLERIAILGPALVTAPLPERPRRSTSPSVTGPNPRGAVWSAPPPPISVDGPPKTPPWIHHLLWVGLFLIVVGGAFLAAVKLASKPVKEAASAPPPAISVIAPPVPTTMPPSPATAADTGTVAAKPVVTAATKPHGTARSKPSTKPPASNTADHGGGDIPATRE
jgi:eukaryotic-like serine/threonine-protein kinase